MANFAKAQKGFTIIVMWLLKSPFSYKSKRIFADTAAGTSVSPTVLKVVNRLSGKLVGNPGSLHAEGETTAKILKEARAKLAKLLGVFSDEIYFTGGGTESNNLAILGTAVAYQEQTGQAGHLIVLATEHLSVLNPARELEKRGVAVTFLKVNQVGEPDWEELKTALRPDTFLVSLHRANNETGKIVDLTAAEKIITKFKKDQGVSLANLPNAYPYLHTDACQAPRTLSLEAKSLPANLITLTASKSYGPKGVGVLVIKRGTNLKPSVFGGGQENGLRSGTPAVALIVGLVAALENAQKNCLKQEQKLRRLTDNFIEQLKNNFPNCTINSPNERLANTVNVSFPKIESEFLITKLDYLGVAASTGSACSSAADEESHVIKAIGGKPGESIRFSFDQTLTQREINQVVKVLKRVLY